MAQTPVRNTPSPGRRVYVAVESGSTDVNGQTIVYTRGVTRVREGHPLLDAVPDYFEPITEHVHYEWETR